MHNYKEEARAARLRVLEMVYTAGSSHIGSNFSVIDILTVLFANLTKDDQVILSAGWKAAAFYYFLAKHGHFPESELDTYNQEGSRLIGLTEPGVPGVLFAGGSMQMGLPAAVGFALAKKLSGQAGRVYCILSDGELAGGMIWESSRIAVAHKLDNLIVLVDDNGLQAMGKTISIVPSFLPMYPSVNIDGHNFVDIELALKSGKHVIFKTIKGKGWKRAEGNNLYHYKDLSYDEYNEARGEILRGEEVPVLP